jgi:hypothetical protein
MPHKYINGPGQTLTFRFEVARATPYGGEEEPDAGPFLCNVLSHVCPFLVMTLLKIASKLSVKGKLGCNQI